MHICENCSSLHEGNIGSGRFCSLKCSRSFSTKLKSEEINRKTSLTIKSKNLGHGDITSECKWCKINFTVQYRRRNQKTCSVACSRALTWSSEERKKELSYKISKRNSEGNFSFTFGNKKCLFDFNGEEIRCDSLLEKRGLGKMTEEFDLILIKRSEIFIEYNFEDRTRVFNPDFYLETKDEKIVLECKTHMNEREDNKNSRKLYFLTVPAKKKSMIEYCKKNNFTGLWYDGIEIEILCNSNQVDSEN